MATKYSESFVEQALTKVYSRGERDIQSVARELNMSHHTLKNWMTNKNKHERSKAMGNPTQSQDKRPQDWKPAEQLRALMQTYSLSEPERNAWCREHGLFAHDLIAWQQALTTSNSGSANPQELRSLKDENHQLKRELMRKEKALAEAAALLVLQKKFRAMWEDEAT